MIGKNKSGTAVGIKVVLHCYVILPMCNYLVDYFKQLNYEFINILTILWSKLNVIGIQFSLKKSNNNTQGTN